MAVSRSITRDGIAEWGFPLGAVLDAVQSAKMIIAVDAGKSIPPPFVVLPLVPVRLSPFLAALLVLDPHGLFFLQATGDSIKALRLLSSRMKAVENARSLHSGRDDRFV
jgi:hypothetical protein